MSGEVQTWYTKYGGKQKNFGNQYSLGGGASDETRNQNHKESTPGSDGQEQAGNDTPPPGETDANS